jgi:hypothetical protein
MLVVATRVLAQAGLSAPPIAPIPDVPPVVTPANPLLEPEEQPTFSQRCFAVPAQVWVPLPSGRFRAVSAASRAPLSSFHPAAPVTLPADAPTTGGTGGGSSGSGSGGGLGDAKALLVLAVVLIAALPVILYVFDDDAPAAVEQRFFCPSFSFDAHGGFDVGTFGVAPGGMGRLQFGYGYFGADFQFDLSAGGLQSFAGHVMLRFKPKAIIEPNLAVGYRSMSLLGQTRNAVEIGVPHRYVFWRSGLREFALELRPTLQVVTNPGASPVDVGLEGGFLIPVVEPIHVRVGGKVQSFGDAVVGGVFGGLAFGI